VQENGEKRISVLWRDMLKYYAFSYDMEVFVVNITSNQLEDRRKSYGWNARRCAVLDPFCSKIQGGDLSAVSSLNKNLKNEKIWYYMLARLRITALNYNGLPTNIKVPTRKTSNRQFKLVADSAAIVNENGVSVVAEDDNPSDNETSNELNVSNVSNEDNVDLNMSDVLDALPNDPGSTEKRDLSFKLANFGGSSKILKLCFKCNEPECGDPKNCKSTVGLIPADTLPQLDDKITRLLDTLCEFNMERSAPNTHEENERDRVVKYIENCIVKLGIIHDIPFKQAKLSLFGSSKNGFGLKSSDLDICMVLDDDTSQPEKEQTVEVIKCLGAQMRNFSGFTNVMWIPNARIPIVKLNLHGYDADISLYNLLATHKDPQRQNSHCEVEFARIRC